MIAGQDKELKLLDKTSAEFAKKELAPNREAHDRFPFAPFFTRVLEKALELDFFHVTLPEVHGGIGHGITALSVVLYNICREDSSLGAIIFTHTAAQELLLAAGAEYLVARAPAKTASAPEFLIAFPVFNNPSDVTGSLVCQKTDAGYRLSGAADYVVLGSVAGRALVPAWREGTDRFSFFMVELSGPGVAVSDPVHSLGLHACPAAGIRLENAAAVPVGEEGQGQAYFEKMADRMSAAAAAMSAGIMKGAFDEALSYSRGRFQGGREIINWSEVRMILADMALAVQNAKMLVSRACQAVDAEERHWQQSARAAAILVQKAACGETASGIQVLGGVGYMKDFGQEKRFRDAQHLQTLLGMAPLRKLRFFDHIR
jgi:alkylation response protein AidB-like acyl-CoA dehydrogenase